MTTTQPAGRSIKQFCSETGLSPSWFHELRHRCPEKFDIIKVFNKTVVLSDPREFLKSFRAPATPESRT